MRFRVVGVFFLSVLYIYIYIYMKDKHDVMKNQYIIVFCHVIFGA